MVGHVACISLSAEFVGIGDPYSKAQAQRRASSRRWVRFLGTHSPKSLFFKKFSSFHPAVFESEPPERLKRIPLLSCGSWKRDRHWWYSPSFRLEQNPPAMTAVQHFWESRKSPMKYPKRKIQRTPPQTERAAPPFMPLSSFILHVLQVTLQCAVLFLASSGLEHCPTRADFRLLWLRGVKIEWMHMHSTPGYTFSSDSCRDCPCCQSNEYSFWKMSVNNGKASCLRPDRPNFVEFEYVSHPVQIESVACPKQYLQSEFRTERLWTDWRRIYCGSWCCWPCRSEPVRFPLTWNWELWSHPLRQNCSQRCKSAWWHPHLAPPSFAVLAVNVLS